jgi:hypothetical protein
MTPEFAGVLALRRDHLLTAPFSIWFGGAIGVFTDLYLKVILVYLLAVNVLVAEAARAADVAAGAGDRLHRRSAPCSTTPRRQPDRARHARRGLGRRHHAEPERPGAEHGRVPAASRVHARCGRGSRASVSSPPAARSA